MKWSSLWNELTEKVNTNLATFTSSYSAPRTPVAKAKEAIENIVDTTPKHIDVRPTVVEDDDITEGNVSDDDDAWVDAILNS